MTMDDELADWTILVYIAAHNDLDEYGLRSLNQVLQAGSTARVKLVALFDSWQGATRYVAGEPGGQAAAVKEPLGTFDSGLPDPLLDTARWAFATCPARQYGLVLWSHGSGHWNQKDLQHVAREARGPSADIDPKERDAATHTMPLFRSTLRQIMRAQDPAERAILFDNGTQHSLDTLQLAQVCDALYATLGRPLDLLGMDACLMATLEVAYELRRSVRTLVASEELVPGDSWPYEAIFGRLHAAPEQNAAALARAMVQDFTQYYTDHAAGAGDVTQVALDLAQIEHLVVPIQQLSAALQNEMAGEWEHVWAAQNRAYTKEVARPNRNPRLTKFGFYLWDVRTLAVGLAELAGGAAVRQAAQAVVTAFDSTSAVLANAHLGAWFDGIGGTSVYMTPMDASKPMSAQYAELAFAKATGWGEMLKSYRQMWL